MVELSITNQLIVEKKQQYKIWLYPNAENKPLNKLAKKHKMSRSDLLGKLITQANAKT